jgi:hypothetical protein
MLTQEVEQSLIKFFAIAILVVYEFAMENGVALEVLEPIVNRTSKQPNGDRIVISSDRIFHNTVTHDSS